MLAAAAAAVLAWPSAATARGSTRPRSSTVGALPGRLRARWAPRSSTTVQDGWVADLAEVVAVGLRAGLDLPAALAVAARSPAVTAAAPWLAERCGGGSSPVAAVADPPPGVGGRTASDLAVLARAWRVSEATGAAASHTTAAAAASVRARQEAGRRVGAALAGPRASMRLLTLLPLSGPLVGLLIGIEPGSLYGSIPARMAGLAGLLLTVAGWWWSGALVGRAQRPADTAGRP
ncbi:tight adherence protein B [Phycicoccus duodecadis]|uniref:Tight adherence protein B n=2 Tax=Phycicoccus duodecadis TaxID=173053 RepID=A0A2N3YI38_9MICO|nr:tight adherence protein B [Phycicoccus duodecadis]